MLIDLTWLEELCDGDDGFKTSFCEQLTTTLERHGVALREASSRRDRAVLQGEAHGLKGMAFTVGARRLGTMCGRLEVCAARGRFDALERLVARIVELLEANRQYVVRYRGLAA